MKGVALLLLWLACVPSAFARDPDPEDFPVAVTILAPGVLLTMNQVGCVWALDCVTRGVATIDGKAVMLACPIYASPELRPGVYRGRYTSKVRWPMQIPVDEHLRPEVTQDIQLLTLTSKGKAKIAEYWVVP